MKVDTVRMMTMTALMAEAMSTTAFAGSWKSTTGPADGIRTMMEAVRRTDGSGSTATMTDIRNASILIPTGMC